MLDFNGSNLVLVVVEVQYHSRFESDGCIRIGSMTVFASIREYHGSFETAV